MATILPEIFDNGDFPAWLQQFECCASANAWADEDKALKLPAFLRGVAAVYFHALTDVQTDSYSHLIENLKAACALLFARRCCMLTSQPLCYITRRIQQNICIH